MSCTTEIFCIYCNFHSIIEECRRSFTTLWRIINCIKSTIFHEENFGQETVFVFIFFNCILNIFFVFDIYGIRLTINNLVGVKGLINFIEAFFVLCVFKRNCRRFVCNNAILTEDIAEFVKNFLEEIL